MLHKILPALAMSLGLALGAPALSEEVNADTVMATVNGRPITLGHMIVLKTQLPPEYQQLPDEVLFNGLLEQLIRQEVLAQKVDTISKRLRLQLENERRAVLASTVLEKAAQDAVTEEAIRKAYEAAVAAMEPVTEYNASHILVGTREEAEEIIRELEAGADFATLAKEKSTGPSGPNGGNLGWFTEGQMVKPFEEAVTALEPGEISEPIQTQFGWHVAKLNDRRERPVPTLEEMREELIAQLRQEVIEAAIEELVAKADVKRNEIEGIDPSVLSDLSLVED
ncbi:peptidyl-prolyl cis-trans isomerase C [Meinhardsimonia xiamenensis]|jgi:peptidyl-prolyl cis-trans isomerase C|uniref:Parvulin-like PPIase n=1 Tax=Meinhardsimonia xiamenensis TaxID=990712 RepID=A0A1G9DV95_9RHOB|nr:peptidylprolyl isomerase [Meinhardsimonia xiamenensis]PRX31185.1 peptidyl-prolyl cis-trans isomerase C [Meinhardsimonia xiamenensis]SDK67768.1 peptidyl-prolyl cis-trans isomerase C [Meinhardsimonia xiamenensis]